MFGLEAKYFRMVHLHDFLRIYNLNWKQRITKNEIYKSPNVTSRDIGIKP